MEEIWIEKREGESVRVAINEYQERTYLDIRQHFENQDGEWKPTQKGVTLPLDKIDELKDALDKLEIPESTETAEES